VQALARGEVVVVVDDTRDVADLVAAAELVTARTINFMSIYGRGLTSLALPAARVDELRLPPMVPGWSASRLAVTVSIEARQGVTTGISAPDRAQTIRVAVDPGSSAHDIISPGHVFPLRVDDQGLSAPRTRGEVALALATLAGHGRGAVLCELLDDSGEQAREEARARMMARWSLSRVSHRDLFERLGKTSAQVRAAGNSAFPARG